MPETNSLLITQIRLDGATQPRAELNYQVIEEYSQAMCAGIEFPPVDVFYDGADYWLADGFHRLKAAGAAELDRIAVVIHQGTQQQAQWFSFGVNQAHGLRRTNADKQRAVVAAIAHPMSSGMANREIARHLGVEETMVRSRRPKPAAVKPHPEANELSGSPDGVERGLQKRSASQYGGKAHKSLGVEPRPAEQSDPAPVTEECGGGKPMTVKQGELNQDAQGSQATKAPARTYHIDRSAIKAPDPEITPSEDTPIEGIAGAVEMIMSSRNIARIRLTNNERRYLFSDKPGLQFMREAWKSLGEELTMAESGEYAEVA